MESAIQKDIQLAPLTTFKIGGAAKYFVDVMTEDDVRAAIHWAHGKNIKFVLLAGGSNVLIPDEGFDGLVIHVSGGGYSFADNELAADAGCDLLTLIRETGRRGFGGWEKIAGIPGTVGGAVRGNAGAFGSEIKDFVHMVKAINTNTGTMRDFTNAECGFQYRDSFFKQHPKWFVARAYVRLKKVNPAASANLVEETIVERERRHLQNVRAAGSYFMNPQASPEIVAMFEREKQVKSRESRVPAGWLIEKAGMKGATVGGAIASLQHPNYIVNQGNATAGDVKALAQKIKIAVMSQFGIPVHEEAAIL